jgi:hypothetical protein
LLLRQLARMHHDKAQFLLGDPSRVILKCFLKISSEPPRF